MHRTPVSSSNMKSVGYDAESMTLEIEFSGGTVYQYFDVPEAVHLELMNSDSKGTFFSAQIKGAYRYARS
jgi:KTSC domain